jgi:hypothetical protein
MRQFLGILIVIGVLLMFKNLYSKYEAIKKEGSGFGQTTPASNANDSSSALPGLPPTLETPLQAAQKQGAEGLRNFLAQYGYAIKDPKLAAIELDYVVLVNLKDPVEARRVFKAVEERTPTSSPVYERVKRLAKTYQ